jgi:hypothetical protein
MEEDRQRERGREGKIDGRRKTEREGGDILNVCLGERWKEKKREGRDTEGEERDIDREI